MDRAVITEVYVDDLYDEYLLIKKIDAIIRMMGKGERLVVVLIDEARVQAQNQGECR